jgi:glutamate carboxypeptidase
MRFKHPSFLILAVASLFLSACSSAKIAPAPATPSVPWTPESALQALVEINSGTSNREGVNQVQARVAQRLAELGFQTALIDPPAGSEPSGKLLVATLSGTSAEKITFLMHADTVFEPSSPFRGFVRSTDGVTARGPGIIDDKGGIVVALDGISKYLTSFHGAKPPRSLEVIVSPGEETGSTAFTKMFADFAKNTRMVLSFEPGRIDGSIVKERKGNRWYSIRVYGKESHSGKDPRQGVNACLELTGILSKISHLTNYPTGTTTSVGHMQGGQDKFNIVCGEASAKVDTRFVTIAARDRLHAAILKILGKSEVRSADGGIPTRIEFTVVDDSPPLEAIPASRPFIDKYLAAIGRAEGKIPEALSTGGTGDANTFGGTGAVILDGLGPIGDHMHTPEEFIRLPSLRTRSDALADFLVNLR